MLFRNQADISPQRAMPVENVDDSSKIITESGETVALNYYNSGVLTADAGQAAGVLVVGKFAYSPILDDMGSKVANKDNKSLSFTCLAFTTEKPFPYEKLEQSFDTTGTILLQNICAGFSNGDYTVDYRTGTIYGKKATTATSLTSTTYKRPSSTATVDVGDIEIGAVEIKDGGSDARANVLPANTARTTATNVVATQNIDANGLVKNVDVDDSVFTPATSQLQVSGGTVTNDNVDQEDKGAFAMTLDRRLKVDTDCFGDGLAAYSNRRGDFSATITNATKTITVTGLPFTLEAGHVQSIIKVDSSGNKYTMPMTNITVSGGVITVTDMPSAGFVTGDTVSVLLIGPTKAYDRSLDILKTINQSPDRSSYVADSLLDTTNVAAATNYYPSATGMSMDGYKDLSITGKFIDADGTMTLTVEGTNDEDTTNADWIQLYAYDTKNNTTTNSWTVTNSTLTFAIDFDNLNYSYFRVKMVNDGATNTAIIKLRRKSL